MVRVELTEDAKEDLRDLDGSVRTLVFKALQKLRVDPGQRGEPLGRRTTGNLTSFRKLVVGNRDYRIVYRIESDGAVVVVWVIGRRADDEVYELAMARLKMHGSPMAQEFATALEEIWRR